MILEEYCTWDTSKLLYDADFPQEEPLQYYVEIIGLCGREYFAKPTQSLAMRWLREEQNLAILFEIITPSEAREYDLNVGAYRMNLCEANTGCHIDVDDSISIGADMIGYATYEAAAEAGIQAACKYIIKEGDKQ